jgi:3-oxoacyl-[acyl-carrier protein] reductase
MQLTDVKALVTGGSAGIGQAIAQALVAAGGKVAISGRDGVRLTEAAREVGATAIQGDVSIEADAVRMVRQTIDAFGDYNVLVNNAGIGSFAPLVEMTVEHMRRQWEVNVLGATLVARDSARHFVARNYGNIINISSTSGLRGGAGSGGYSSTKFALRGLTESWRGELRKHNVRVMLVNPSEVVTEFAQRAGFEQKDHASKLRAQEIAHSVLGMLTMDDRGFIPELSVWATNPQ